MTVHVLVTGTLFRAAERRTSSTGKSYVKAALRSAAVDNSGSEFFDVLTFSETAGDELLRLETNERVAIQGALKLELYAPEGKPPKIQRTIFVDHVLALRAPRKDKKPKEPAASARPQNQLERVSIIPPAEEPSRRGELDDDIPF